MTFLHLGAKIRLLNVGITIRTVLGIYKGGFVVDTMKWVLYWLLTSESFLDVVIGAANEGYDTDTVGAIAGGLAGLAYGFDELPREYTEVLLVKNERIAALPRYLTNISIFSLNFFFGKKFSRNS
jgi:ADP-ribosylglycohydrolase